MRSLRVLVAEDNPVNQRLICLQLRKVGVAADIAGNGFEVLEAIERGHYDVVFMDCQMPELDGYETTRRIRSGGRHTSIRIVAMTANAMQGDRELCLAAGMDDYVSKPIRVEELLAALERTAARESERARASRSAGSGPNRSELERESDEVLDRAFTELATFECEFLVENFWLYVHDDVLGWIPNRDFPLTAASD